MASRYTYGLEVLGEDGEWTKLYGLQGEQRGFLAGYMMGSGDAPPPRLGMRLVRSDGKVIDERAADPEVGIGMIAGWPTAEQYEGAAERAMERARRIRAMDKRSGR